MAPRVADMPSMVAEEEFDFSDLDLGELTVTSMRDTVAMPESGVSSYSKGCSCSCVKPY